MKRIRWISPLHWRTDPPPPPPCLKDWECAPFARPVDPIMDGVPDYSAIVQHPMDLGSISSRLKRGGYVSPQVQGYLANKKTPPHRTLQ